jgi:hypothetical protein
MWKSKRVPVDVKNIRINIDTQERNDEYGITDEMVRNAIFDELYNELKKNYSEYVVIQKNYNALSPFTVNYTAQITVAPTGMSTVMMDKHHYEVNGVKFTHEEIEGAVTKAFPEYFI